MWSWLFLLTKEGYSKAVARLKCYFLRFRGRDASLLAILYLHFPSMHIDLNLASMQIFSPQACSYKRSPFCMCGRNTKFCLDNTQWKIFICCTLAVYECLLNRHIQQNVSLAVKTNRLRMYVWAHHSCISRLTTWKCFKYVVFDSLLYFCSSKELTVPSTSLDW